MIKEKIKPSVAIDCPHYLYVDKSNVTVAANSYTYLTLTFSSGVFWDKQVICSLFQTDGCTTNVCPSTGTTARIYIKNHTGSSKTGILRVMALLSVDVTATLS